MTGLPPDHPPFSKDGHLGRCGMMAASPHLFCDLGPPFTLGSIGPPFSKKGYFGFLAGAVFWPHRPLIFRFMASLHHRGLSAPRFPKRGILDFGLCGILAESVPLFFDLGPPRTQGSTGPRFPERGILVGAVFWPHRPLIFRFRGSFHPEGLPAPVFQKRGIFDFWSVRHSGRIGPLIFRFMASFHPGAYRPPPFST